MWGYYCKLYRNSGTQGHLQEWAVCADSCHPALYPYMLAASLIKGWRMFPFLFNDRMWPNWPAQNCLFPAKPGYAPSCVLGSSWSIRSLNTLLGSEHSWVPSHSSCPSRSFRCDWSHHDPLTPAEPSNTMWRSNSLLHWVRCSRLRKYYQCSYWITYWVSSMGQVLVKPSAGQTVDESRCGTCPGSCPVYWKRSTAN